LKYAVEPVKPGANEFVTRNGKLKLTSVPSRRRMMIASYYPKTPKPLVSMLKLEIRG
jgi:hypothetical protein